MLPAHTATEMHAVRSLTEITETAYVVLACAGTRYYHSYPTALHAWPIPQYSQYMLQHPVLSVARHIPAAYDMT